MRFDIARQPLVPAFLTLLALALLAAGSFGAANAAAAGIPHAAFAAAPDGLVTGLPQQALLNLQLHHPLWAGGLGVVLLLAGGLHLGRLSTRYNLYGVSSCLAIPLYGAALCLAGFGDQYLTALTESLLLVLAFKNYCRAFGNGYRFDALFRASLSLGLLPLLRPALLPLVLLLPAAVWIFRRTLREATVACVGLLLPAAAWCYVNWGAGGTLAAPLLHIAGAFTDGAPFALLRELTTPELLAAGILVLLTLLAALHLLTEFYTTGLKPRFILLFGFITLLLGVLLLCGPGAAPADRTLLALPAALLLPFSFVRISPRIVWPLYLLLVGGAGISLFLQ